MSEPADFQFAADSFDWSVIDVEPLDANEVQLDLENITLVDDTELTNLAGSYEWTDDSNIALLDFSIYGDQTSATFDGWAVDGIGSGVSGIFSAEA